MKNLILIILFTLFSTLSVFAQVEKKGCNPSACSPGNTKVDEAIIITKLRENIASTKEGLKIKEISENPNIEIGKDEQSSLLIMSNEINKIEKALGLKPTDFTELQGAALVKKLKTVLKTLQE